MTDHRAERPTLADLIFGRRCALGCGGRLYPKDVARHLGWDHSEADAAEIARLEDVAAAKAWLAGGQR